MRLHKFTVDLTKEQIEEIVMKDESIKTVEKLQIK
jgi:hypothetical protein